MQKKIMLLMKYVILGVAVLSVLVTGTRLIKRACKTEIKTYHVVEQYTGNVVTTESYTKEFLCVGKTMECLQVEADTGRGESGFVFYEILDENGEVLLSNQEQVQALERNDTQGFFIDVENIGMKQGEFYTLHMDFSKASDVCLTLGNGNLSIRQYYMSSYQVYYIVLLVVLFGIALFWLWFSYKKAFDTKLFVFTALFIGLCAAVIMPPANRDDEYRHFIRSYEGAMKDVEMFHASLDGSENGLIGMAVGVDEVMAEVPYQINELRLMDTEYNYNGYGYVQEVNNVLCIDKLIATSKVKNHEERYRVSLAVTGYRSDLYYWPQILAMKIFLFLGSDCVWLYYIARIGQVVACVLFEAFAMKIAPKIKEMIWLIALIPNTILLQASCNSDGLLIAEIILLVAVVVWMKENKIDIISKKGALGWLAFFTLSYSIVKMKIPYALVCIGTLLYLTKDNFKKELSFVKRHKKFVVPGVCVMLMLVLGWLIATNGAFIWNFIYRVVPKAHVDYIFDNPKYILILFSNKWLQMTGELYGAMKGSNHFPYPLMIVAILLFMKKAQPLWKRFGIAVLFGLMIMVIVLVGYTMTPPYYGSVWGITYRYLLPFVSFGALCLPSGNEKTEKIAVQFVPLCIFVMMSQTLMSWLVGWSI